MSSLAVRVAVAFLLPTAAAFAQMTEPSKVLPPTPQKTTVSGPLTTVGPQGVQRQQIEKTTITAQSPAPPVEIVRAKAEDPSLSLAQPASSAPQWLETQEFTPWLSTPSVNWFALASKNLPKSWEPPAPLKETSFNQPAKGAPTSWEQKPTAAFDTAPSTAPARVWDDNRDPRLKGSKVDWK